MQRVTEKQNRVNIYDRMWARLLSTTNQPAFIDAEMSDDEETLTPSSPSLSSSSPQLTSSLHQKSKNGVLLTQKELDGVAKIEWEKSFFCFLSRLSAWITQTSIAYLTSPPTPWNNGLHLLSRDNGDNSKTIHIRFKARLSHVKKTKVNDSWNPFSNLSLYHCNH